MNIYFLDGNAKSFLYSELDIFHYVVSYFADANSIFEDHIQVNDYPLIHNSDLNATAITLSL